MIEAFRIRVQSLILLFLVFGLADVAVAQNRVVVVPLGGDSSLSTDASISIPISSLFTEFPDAFGSNGLLKLVDFGPIIFGSSFVVPTDHKPGSTVFLDLQVYNPGTNGQCTVDIRAWEGVRYRAGESEVLSGQFYSDSPFPESFNGDSSNVHTYQFADDVRTGDAIHFKIIRFFNSDIDRCDSVFVVGMNVRYTRE